MVGYKSGRCAVTPDGVSAYVISSTTHGVWVIDGATNPATTLIPGSKSATLQVAITPDGTRRPAPALTEHLTSLWKTGFFKIGDLPISTVKKSSKRPSVQTKELRPVARRLGALALSRHRQGGGFRVREREQLRRALFSAGRELRWDVVAVNREAPVDEVVVDVRRLTRAGLGAIEKDLESEIAEKAQEVRQLKRVVKKLAKLSKQDESAFPVEVEYHHTSAVDDQYSTKTAEFEVEGPDSAEQAAQKLEKQLDRFGRLRDQMVEKLKDKRRALDATKSELKDFVGMTRPLIDEVLVVLQ